MEEKTEFRSLFSHLKNIVLQLFFENAKFFCKGFSERATGPPLSTNSETGPPPVYEFRDRAPPVYEKILQKI